MLYRNKSSNQRESATPYMRNAAKTQFERTMKREGKNVTAYTGGTEFRAFFRTRDEHENKRETIIMYYDVTAPVRPGTLIMMGYGVFLALNRKTVENDIYYKSTLIKCNGVFNENSGKVNNVPFYCDNMKSSVSIGNSVLKMLNGNIEAITEENSLSSDIKEEYATKVSFPSENTLSRKSNCGISTVKKYIQSLCNIKMLYMKNYGSYLRMFKGKEVVVNSNNVYALEEKYLNSYGEETLRSYLKFNMGYIDCFYPFCDNLPDNNEKENKSDDWGRPNSMDMSEDFSIEEMLDMPVMVDLLSNSEESTLSEGKPIDISTFSMNPIKTIIIKKKEQNREIPIEIILPIRMCSNQLQSIKMLQ